MDYERLAYCCRERSKREMEDATQITLEEAATALSALQAENEKLRAELEQVKQELDAAVKCIEEIEDAFNFQRMSAIGLRISEWRGPQKED